VAPAPRAILDANYGRKDSEEEERVEQVFRDVETRSTLSTRVASVTSDIGIETGPVT
jgi:hypothetical protein